MLSGEVMTEWDPQAYNQVSKLQQWLAEKSLASVTFGGHEHVLDLGCGDGKVSAEIAARLPHGSVRGVDASHDMIAFAARTFPPSLHPNLAFQVADAARLGFTEEFDLVVSFNCLHWVHDQAAALRGIRAALAPSGRAHLRLVARGARTSLEAVIEEARKTPAWAAYFPAYQAPFVHFTAEEYRDLAERAGLRVERLDVEQEAWDFHSRAAFVRFAEATFVEWTRLVPADQQHAFIDDVLERYNAHGDVFTFYQMQALLRPV